MLHAVNAYLHTYGDGGGWREIVEGPIKADLVVIGLTGSSA
jgi:hypothetical protein